MQIAKNWPAERNSNKAAIPDSSIQVILLASRFEEQTKGSS
jgi:tetrahydromethanopterin S-methyltransferase subunit A